MHLKKGYLPEFVILIEALFDHFWVVKFVDFKKLWSSHYF
jgi:hypothetical protein